MGLFTYTARDAAGQRITGRLVGASEQVVLAELSARALAPIAVREVRERRSLRRGVSTRRLAGVYRQLADLLRAGVPLLRALRLLGRSKATPHLSKVMNEIADAVADGARLADAMEARADVFPAVHIAMVRAGEMGGFLEQVLARLGDFLEHQADMKAKVTGNLIYPVILLSMAVLVVVGALVFFVPKFRPMFERIELPLSTQLLLGASAALTDHWAWVLVGLTAAAFGAAWTLRRPGMGRRLAQWQLRTPGLGAFISALSVARFTRILGTMLGNGIPMLAAMKISRDAAGHLVLAEAIDEATESVRQGESLTAPLGQSGMLGDDMIEMIAVGEAANNLPDVLTTIADTIEKRIDRILSTMLRLMEPILLMLLAGVVVFIFMALFMPMMQLSSSIGQ